MVSFTSACSSSSIVSCQLLRHERSRTQWGYCRRGAYDLVPAPNGAVITLIANRCHLAVRQRRAATVLAGFRVLRAVPSCDLRRTAHEQYRNDGCSPPFGGDGGAGRAAGTLCMREELAVQVMARCGGDGGRRDGNSASAAALPPMRRKTAAVPPGNFRVAYRVQQHNDWRDDHERIVEQIPAADAAAGEALGRRARSATAIKCMTKR